MKKLIRWEKKIDPEHIDAALGYLRLLFKKSKVKDIEQKLKQFSSNLTYHKAADLIRASSSQITPVTQKDVASQLQKIILKKPLQPIIIITSGEKLYIADGYHRICACYNIDDEIEIAAVQIEI